MNALWHEVWRGVQNDFADLPGVAEVTQIVLATCSATRWSAGLPTSGSAKRRGSGLTCSRLSGPAFFVMIPYQAGMPLADLSRVLQGVITGMGFLGPGRSSSDRRRSTLRA